MASIKKRGKGYEIRIWDKVNKSWLNYKYYPDDDLPPKQLEKAVNRYADELEQKLKKGTLANGKVKFSDFSEMWYTNHCLKNLKAKTTDTYRIILDRCNEYFGACKMENITPKMILDFFNELDTTAKRNTKYKAVSGKELKGLLKAEGTLKTCASNYGMALSTLKAAIRGSNISKSTADIISNALNKEELFIIAEQAENLSRRTQKHYHEVLSSLFSYSVSWGVLVDNPCKNVRAPKVQPSDPRYYDTTEVAKMLALIQKEPVDKKVAVYIALYTGMRRGEIAGLKWDNVDLENGVIFVNQTLLKTKSGIIIDTPKNKSSIRPIRISKALIKILKAYKLWQDEQKKVLEGYWIETGYVFTRNNGELVDPDSFTHWMTDFIKRNTLAPISFHGLRHTSATLLISSGLPVKAVSGRLGHARQSTTTDIYDHFIKSVDIMAAEALDSIFEDIANLDSMD